MELSSLFHQALWFNKARTSLEGKRRLNDWWVFLGGGAVALFVLWGMWRAFIVEGPTESVIRATDQQGILTELESHSHEEGSKGLQDTFTDEHQSGGGRKIVSNVTESQKRTVGLLPQGGATISVKQGDNSSTDRLERGTANASTGLPPYYRLGKPVEDWDRHRQLWLEKHPWIKNRTEDGRQRLFMLTGSQPGRCKSPTGDHLLLRSFKNKMDYCRFHGMEMFYNVAILDKKMDSFWSKLPLVRAAMVAHPEAEWLWWVDSDLVITDIEFEIPLERYRDYNLVVHGWESEVFENRSWVGLNAGSFLVRNCEWTMRFLERWASMGPKGSIRDEAGKIQSAFFWDRPRDYPGDDKAALIYIMVTERERWGNKVLLEGSYNLNGYWIDIVGSYEKVEEAYKRVEEQHEDLVHGRDEEIGEKMALRYGRMREGYLAHEIKEKERRSFVTHFAGCQPCTGNHNPAFDGEKCVAEMERALNFADNQVLRSYGFKHPSLDTDDVERLD